MVFASIHYEIVSSYKGERRCRIGFFLQRALYISELGLGPVFFRMNLRVPGFWELFL